MRVLLLSVIAKSGAFTHVRDLAVQMQKSGMNPVVGFLYDHKCRVRFKLLYHELPAMLKSLGRIPYFIYASDAELVRQAKARQIQLLHAQSSYVLPAAADIAQMFHVPLAVTLHGVLHWRKLYRRELDYADKIIAVGPEVAASAGQEYAHKTKIIYNGIDLDFFHPPAKRTYEGPLRILWIGRTVGRDALGAGCLSAAVGLLRQQGIPIIAKGIGHAAGADLAQLENCGWVEDTRTYLQWSHLVFARGRALREAMACGNVGFLLGEGYGGVFDESRFECERPLQLSGSLKHGAQQPDPRRMADDIEYFYHHREHLAAAGEKARNLAEVHFDIRLMAAQTCDVYKQCLEHKQQDKALCSKTARRPVCANKRYIGRAGYSQPLKNLLVY